MKRITIALLLTIMLLCMPLTVLAGSFGVSPSNAEFEVPKDGSTTQDFTFTGYTGTVTIGLENIPLEVSPIGNIEVTDGETVGITFSGDGTNNTYEGKITFLASTGEQALTGIKVRLTIHVNMTTEVIPEPTPPSGNGREPIYSTKTDFFDTEGAFYTDSKGKVQKTVKATFKDGNLTVTIPKGTTALGEDGKRLKTLEAAIDTSPPEPPWDATIIGIPYDFGPSGATFEPPIVFTWEYHPETLPKGVSEEDLVLAYWTDGRWIQLECSINTKLNIITALVNHFTTFAIMGAIIPITPAPTPPIVPPVVPAPIPPAPVELPPPVIIPAPEPLPEPPVIVPEPAPEPSVEPTPATPWVLIYTLILGGLFVIGLGIFWYIKRKRARRYD